MSNRKRGRRQWASGECRAFIFRLTFDIYLILYIIPYHPWDGCIYLHEWLNFMVNIGKYTVHGFYGNGLIYFCCF